MKITKLKNTCVVALVTALLTLGATATQAAVCTVPGDHPTIQSAATDGTCATINVAAGVYNENVTVTHSCEINGAQAGNAFSGRISGNPAESTVNSTSTVGSSATFTILAADVTIDGFTIRNNANTAGAANGVVVKAVGNDSAILNNILDMISTPDAGGNGTAQAVYLENGPDGVNIENNEMKNIQSNRSAKGVLIGDSVAPSASNNVQVKGNSIHDVTSTTRGAYGVSMGNIMGASGLMILKNDITNLNSGGWIHAVGLERDTPGVIVMDNNFSALNTGSLDRSAVFFESNPSFGTAEVHNNNFDLTPAAYGIAVHPDLATAFPSANVRGNCNWWGSPSGPTTPSNPGGTGAQVSSNVTYRPWLIAPAPGGNCFGGNVPTTANQCKNGGWMMSVRADGSTFKNQGDCIQYVNTGR
jgi:hypothetical protein